MSRFYLRRVTFLPDVYVTGADKLVSLGRRLRAAGDKELKKELRTALRDATKPMKAAIKKNALDNMPHRGGLNEYLSKSRITTQVRQSGRNPGIRISNKQHDTRLDTQGRLRHPVYGNRDAWVEQKVKPGWFTEPAEREARQARVEILLAIKRVEKSLEAR